MTEVPKRTYFANILVRMFLTRNATKRLFRRPYMRFGNLIAGCAYVFQTSGLLACHFRKRAESFVVVFAASADPPTTVRMMTTEWTAEVKSRLHPAESILDYMKRVTDPSNSSDNPSEDWVTRIGERVAYESAFEILQRNALDGVALGLGDPDCFRLFFEQTHAPLDDGAKQRWSRARDAGVDIPENPDELNYDECAAEALEMFADYCREVFPDFAPNLGLE